MRFFISDVNFSSTRRCSLQHSYSHRHGLGEKWVILHSVGVTSHPGVSARHTSSILRCGARMAQDLDPITEKFCLKSKKINNLINIRPVEEALASPVPLIRAGASAGCQSGSTETGKYAKPRCDSPHRLQPALAGVRSPLSLVKFKCLRAWIRPQVFRPRCMRYR